MGFRFWDVPSIICALPRSIFESGQCLFKKADLSFSVRTFEIGGGLDLQNGADGPLLLAARREKKRGLQSQISCPEKTFRPPSIPHSLSVMKGIKALKWQKLIRENPKVFSLNLDPRFKLYNRKGTKRGDCRWEKQKKYSYHYFS